MIFYNEKTPFYAIKTRSLKSRKIDIFLKGLIHGFGPKMAIFPMFFLGYIGQENVFYDILKRKNAFLGYKNKKFKKSKNWNFSEGLNPWFGSKMAIFSTFFFFRQYRAGKCLSWYSSTKKRLSRLEKQEDQKIEQLKCFQLFFFFRQYRPGKCLLWYSRTKKRLSRL